MMTRETITVGRQRFRLGPWQADTGVAHLSLPPRSPKPRVEDLRAALEVVRSRGYTSVLTSALEEADTTAFLALGFTEHDRLVVLAHDLSGLDRPAPLPHGTQLRRPRRGDRVERAACGWQCVR